MKTGNLHSQFSWDIDGVVDDLKAWWAEGFSCSLIAENLHDKYGGHPTRNAVIGKVTRLGLPTHKGFSPVRSKSLPRKPRAAPKARIGGKPPRTTPFCPAPDNGSEETISRLNPHEIPLKQRKQLLELRFNHCRFPYGDPGKPEFFFCGGEKLKIAGCPYCLSHYRVTHSGPRYISRAEFERNRILGLRAKERMRLNREGGHA